MAKSVIVSGARTPVGKFGGGLSTLTASDLGGIAIKEALQRADVAPESVDEVILGCVLQGGQGQIPSRQAAQKAGITVGNKNRNDQQSMCFRTSFDHAGRSNHPCRR